MNCNRFDRLHRRDFITLLGGVATWPLAARAQQPAIPVVGILSPSAPGSGQYLLDAFHRGLGESGYVDGQNVSIDHRLAAGRFDRFPEMVADLVQHRVSVIAAFGSGAAVAAKAATQTLPILFAVTENRSVWAWLQASPDPAAMRLVSIFSQRK